MPSEATPSPAWLPWLVALAVAASVVATIGCVGRWLRGQPIIDWRPHDEVPWEGRDVLMVLLAGLASAMLVGGAIGPEPSIEQRLAGSLLVTSVSGLLAIGWLAAHGATPPDLGLVKGHATADVRLAVGSLALVLAPLLALAAVLNQLVPYQHPVMKQLMASRDSWSVGLVVATAIVAAPLVEELFFRRILQGWLEKRLPASDGALAIGLSAAAFALAHQGQGLAFVPLFPLGIVLGMMANRTGSIVPCILLHAFFNAVSVILLLASPAPLVGGPAG